MKSFLKPERAISCLKLFPGMSVADFGTGAGHFALSLASLSPDIQIFAFDIRKEMLERLKKEASLVSIKNIYPILADLEKGTELRENSIDLVLLINTLFQIEDKDAVFREVYRILKENGTLFVVDWEDSFNHLGPHPDHVVKKEEVRDLAQSYSFSFDGECEEVGDHHYGLLFHI